MKNHANAVMAWACAATLAMAAGSVAVADGGPLDAQGWTVLTPSAASRVVYVSSSSGLDSNSGLSSTSPVQSLSRGYSLLRDGSPDFLLLKSGDTWNEAFPTMGKSANSMTQYMVIGAYGTGARPKIRVSSHAIIGTGSTPRRGLAITDLDLAPSAPGSGFNGITFLESWGHVLIEGCLISGFPVNIVIQETGSGRLPDMQIRRCVIVDSFETGTPHSQGIFLGACDDWLIEGCVLDSNARNKADLYCHNAYAHQSNGPGIFKDNISARACSHGVQQRPGGTMENNLFLENPINAYQSKSDTDHPAATNYFRYNVALDSRNINTSLPRGTGFVMGDASNTVVEYNVAAHQRSGTENVVAFDFANVNAATVRYNVVYDWTYNGAGWGTGFQWEGGSGAVLVENNKVYQPNHGMCIRHESRPLSSSFTYGNNSYFSTNPAGGYEAFASSSGTGGNWNWWKTRAAEPGSIFANPGPIDASIGAYLQSIGMNGSVAEFMAQARLQSRANWRDQFTTDVVNNWVRGKFGIGSVPQACYANCDASTVAPVLSGNDFQCFINAFSAGQSYANCDGSTVAPVLNANDFQCFLNRFSAGCP